MSVKKSSKIQKLVVNAIRKLQDVQGSTPREISNYISQEYDVPNTEIQRQVRVALARAVSYGILQRSVGGYYGCNREYNDCQPQTDLVQPIEKCGCTKPSRRRRMKAARGGSCKGARRKRKRRSGGCGTRRRSRRGKSSGGRCGGGGKKSRRRRGSCGAKRKSRRCGGRKKRARRSGRGGKKCASDGTRADKNADEDAFTSSRKGRSGKSLSVTRNDNRGDSRSPSLSDEEHHDDKRSDG